MATYKIIQRIQKKKASGEAPLYLRITHNRKTTFKSTGIYVLPKHWDAEKNIVSTAHPNSKRINFKLSSELNKAQKAALDLEIVDSSVTSKAVKKKLTINGSFLNYFENYVSSLGQTDRIASFKKANTVLEKVKSFLGEADLKFEEVTVSWIKEFEEYLRDELENGVNTIHSNLKILRKLMNEAIREDLFPFHLNPFLKYKLVWKEVPKEYLTEEELKQFELLSFDKEDIRFHQWNMYVFACYAGGIRISDLLKLQWKNYNGTHVTFQMLKTGDTISVKLPTKAKDIIEQYWDNQNPEQLIFPFLQPSDLLSSQALYDAISRSSAHANKNLKEMANSAEINKCLTFHTSRHTWATRALRKGMRIEYVSKILGHKSIKVTQIYVKIVNSELDQAMDVFG